MENSPFLFTSSYEILLTLILLHSCNNAAHLAYAALSGRIGKVVASHAAVARSIPAEVALIYTMHEVLRGYCP